MSAQDAAQLGLSDGDQVVVRSAQGELTAQLKVNRRFPRGLVFVPENYRTLRLNSLMRRGEYPCPVEVERRTRRSSLPHSLRGSRTRLRAAAT